MYRVCCGNGIITKLNDYKQACSLAYELTDELGTYCWVEKE